MPRTGTEIIHVTKQTQKRFAPCIRCGESFKLGDRVVSTRNHGHRKAKHYHIDHYTDAHGEPIFE